MVRTGICNKDFFFYSFTDLIPCEIRIEVSFHFYLRDEQYQE